MKHVVICALCICTASSLEAQKVPRVDPGWGVDTTAAAWAEAPWHASVREIYAAWRQYLLTDAYLQIPTKHWSSSEQRKWPAYDLTAGVAYKGMPATVLDIRPAGNGEFIVKTLFASVSNQVIRPVALTRVFAVREGEQWVFANAMARLTRGWRREVVGEQLLAAL